MPAGVSAYTPLANVTLSGSTSLVTLSSISGSYRDLILVFSGKSAAVSGNDVLIVQYNSDYNNNYSFVRMQGDGSAAYSDATSATSNASAGFVGNTSSGGANVIHQIMDYSATDKHKTTLVRGNNASGNVSAVASRWANTAAINTIWITLSSYSNFTVGSTVALYGVSA